MNKLKVLYVVGGLPFGGIENWLFDLISKLKNDPEIEPVLVNISGTGSKVKDFLQHNLPLINLCSNKKCLSTHRIDTVLKLRKLLKEVNPQIIHTMQFSGDYFGRLAAIGFKAKVITHIHNIKKESKKHRRFLNKVLSFFTDAYIGNSKAVLEVIAKDHNLAQKKAFLVYNSIDFTRLDVEPILKKKYDLTKNKIIIGLGRLVKQKNFSLLIQAMAEVVKDIPEVKLVLIGDGPEKESLLQLARSLNLEDKVLFVGYQKEVGAFLKEADLMVVPSAYEGFGNVVLEALYCGVPVIVSPFVPSIEVVPGGTLVVENDPSALAFNIKKVLLDRELTLKLVETGKKELEKVKFAYHIQELKRVYRNLCSN